MTGRPRRWQRTGPTWRSTWSTGRRACSGTTPTRSSFRATYVFVRTSTPRRRRMRLQVPVPRRARDLRRLHFTVTAWPRRAAATSTKEVESHHRCGARTHRSQLRGDLPLARARRLALRLCRRPAWPKSRDFTLTARTNVRAVDFPAGTMSPTSRERHGGRRLGPDLAVRQPGHRAGHRHRPAERLNPGPLAARITFFAPVSLLFFLAVMVILGVTLRPSRCTR